MSTRVMGPLLALLLGLPGTADARRLTAALQRSIELVATHGSEDEAAALRKLYTLEGYEQLALRKAFVDAALGRESVAFIDRQLQRLQHLRARRPYLQQVIAQLSRTRAMLERRAHLNADPEHATPSNARVLESYHFDATSYRRHVRILAGELPVRLGNKTVRLRDRHTMNDGNTLPETLDFLARSYRQLGLRVELQPFVWRGKRLYNLIATLDGASRETVLLGAHYDTAVDQRARNQVAGARKVSPGADDNASGVAGLMEIARGLRGTRPQKTIQFVHFSGEEQPTSLAGSRAFVAAGRARNVVAALILDCIAYDKGGRNRMLVHSDRSEKALYLGSQIGGAIERLQLGLRQVPRLPGEGRFSITDTDSMAFSRAGIPTVFVSEDLRWRRGLHDRFDRPRLLDYRYAARVVSAISETVARIAGVPRPQVSIGHVRELSARGVLGRYKTAPRAPAHTADELADRRGRIRPEYRALAGALDEQSSSANQRRAKRMQVAARDLTDFRAYPRVVSSREFAELRRGLLQIERMMQAALRDLYSPKSKLVAQGIISRAELNQTEGFDEWFKGIYGRQTRFNFVLRPDLVRDESGRLTVLELNQGYVGGLGDILRTRQLLRGANSQLFDRVAVKPTEDFVAQLVAGLRSLAPKPTAGRQPKIVFYTYGKPEFWADKEDHALKQALEREGVEYVSDDTRKTLKTIRGRVYLVDPSGKRERVDVVYSRKDWTPAEMQTAHARGGVTVFPTPGSSVLESKNLYKHLPRLIRVLLGEKPILRFLTTRSFARADGTIDRRFLEQVLRNPRRWVLKAAVGAQGDGVLVGREASATDLRTFRDKILKNPGAWDAQEYVSASTYNGQRVDLDPFLITTRGRVLIPAGAMVRTARIKGGKFGDAPRFLDTWVLDDARARDPFTRRVGSRTPSAPPRRALDGRAHTSPSQRARPRRVGASHF